MIRFAIDRTVSAVVVLFVLLLLIFTVSRSGGADPVRGYLGANASAEAVAAARERLGLDQPLFVQFGQYLQSLMQGDLGLSLSTRRPVSEELARRIPATAELALWAIFFALILAIVFAGAYSVRGRVAAAIRFVLFSAASAPAFLLATAGVLLLFAQLGWLPASGRTSFGPSDGMTGLYVLDGILAGNPAYAWDAFQHVLLPALAAAVGPGVAIARVLADGVSGSMKSGYAQTARSLGDSELTIVRRHALRNASSPALTLLGVQIGMMLTSLVVVEQIFSWNGLGQYLTSAISAADINAVAAISLVLGAFYVLINTLVDIVLAIVDPRVRLS